jgi:hypothetical protein
MFNAPLPTLVTVMVRAALRLAISCGPKVREFALSAIVGAAAGVPVPLKATLLEPLAALCVNTSKAASAPITVGLNVRSTRQDDAGATLDEVEHVDVGSIRKSFALAPVVAIALKTSAALPLFEAVTECTALEPPAVVAGNAIAGGDTVIEGVGAMFAVPVSATDVVPPGAL